MFADVYFLSVLRVGASGTCAGHFMLRQKSLFSDIAKP
jgi:hypothetical protein